jgi:hypothetical protein
MACHHCKLPLASDNAGADSEQQTQAIDDLHRSAAEVPITETEKRQEGKDLISKFATLKYELQHDRKLT